MIRRLVVVHREWVTSLLSPLIDGHERDYDRYDHININDEAQSKALIEQTVKPRFESISEKQRAVTHVSLKYFLVIRASGHESYWRGCTFEDPGMLVYPSNCRLFFQWVCEVLFPGETLMLEPDTEYVVDTGGIDWLYWNN